jgi:hypothetical protein
MDRLEKYHPLGFLNFESLLEKWEDWKNRFRQNPDYNWRNHSGTQGTPQLHVKQNTKNTK